MSQCFSDDPNYFMLNQVFLKMDDTLTDSKYNAFTLGSHQSWLDSIQTIHT